MVDAFKKLIGLGPSANYAQLVRDGALVLDVRTPSEFEQGHVPGAMNIPIEKLRDNMHQLANKKATIIACCTDGAKSWYAKNLLDATGYNHVYNAGSWKKLNRRLQKQ